MSPSSRRAWIEILLRKRLQLCKRVALLTEGVDRNTLTPKIIYSKKSSPSSRRAWIEIKGIPYTNLIVGVALLTEGVDRNDLGLTLCLRLCRRPPHGGRG